MPLAQLHHSAEVTGADACLRRPIIATASLDRSVRVWNYLDKCAPADALIPVLASEMAFHRATLHMPQPVPSQGQTKIFTSVPSRCGGSYIVEQHARHLHLGATTGQPAQVKAQVGAAMWGSEAEALLPAGAAS